MSKATLQVLIDSLVRDENAKITPNQRDDAIALAVETYSGYRPRKAVEDVTSVAGGQELALPSAWVADFSALSSLEYPIGDVPPSVIAVDEYSFYQTPSTQVIQLINALPAGAIVRATFGIKHTVSTVADTIPTGDRETFCKIAAAHLCDQLAAFYSNNSDSTIAADTVDHKSQAAEYRALANKYRKDFQNALGVDEKTPRPSGVVVAFPQRNSHGGSRMFGPDAA